jgi:hypothetical protein
LRATRRNGPKLGSQLIERLVRFAVQHLSQDLPMFSFRCAAMPNGAALQAPDQVIIKILDVKIASQSSTQCCL